MLAQLSSHSPAVASVGALRVRRLAAAAGNPSQMACWVLAIAVSVIGVSSYGLIQPIQETHVFQVEAAAPESVELEALTMMELSAPEGTQQELETLDEPAEAIQTDLLLEQLLDPVERESPPELALEAVPVALTEEDVFKVPAADDLLELEQLKQPAPPKPLARAAPRTVARPPASPRASGGQPGGSTAGASTAGRSVTKGYFPAPPYPASARSRRLEGTVQLRVTFGPDGRVTSAVVTRSSGYSELDRSASDWVQRRWRGPGGQPGTAQQVIRFKLL